PGLCPTADDIWLYWMIRLARRTVRVVGPRMDLKTWTGSQDGSLWHQNLLQHGNDAQITKMVARYGFPSGRLNAAQAQALTQNLPVAFQFKQTTVRFALPDKDNHIQRFIRSSLSFYELQMLLDIAARVRPGTAILDIGANIGNHTVFFGLFCQAGLVMSFEPQPAVYQTLLRNVSLNALQDCVKTFPVGLGRQARRARLGQVDPNNIGMTKLDLAAEGDIEVRVLDELLHELENPPEVSVIKIDVEGMELDVLQGAGLLLKSQRPMIYAEAATEAELSSLRNYLEPMGYRVLNRFNATATYLFACD
ncbi:FkbM family methyltransferase, partial [Bordetella hinzii]|uniref:FkbM family methyltransferase n=1 Tax=Bordetella hinzii TaxID=103855 RepID=UPI0012D324F5